MLQQLRHYVLRWLVCHGPHEQRRVQRPSGHVRLLVRVRLRRLRGPEREIRPRLLVEQRPAAKMQSSAGPEAGGAESRKHAVLLRRASKRRKLQLSALVKRRGGVLVLRGDDGEPFDEPNVPKFRSVNESKQESISLAHSVAFVEPDNKPFNQSKPRTFG